MTGPRPGGDAGRPRVLVTRALPGGALDRLAEHAEVDLNTEDAPLPRDGLLSRVAGADGLVCLLTDRVDAELLDAAPRLKVVSNYAVGLDNVDLDEARKRRIWVTNTPGVLTDATADLTMALLLAVARRIHEGDRVVRSGQWRGWSPGLLLGRSLQGRRLGLVGLGRVGQAVARRADPFGFDTVYFDPKRLPRTREENLRVRYLSLEELLSTSDLVSLHVPLSEATRRLVGPEEIARMKPDAILVNTSRGEVVHQDALVAALASGRLGGAGLDVFEDEPAVPEALRRMEERVVLLPHIGSATLEARAGMADLAVDSVLEALSGRRPERSVT